MTSDRTKDGWSFIVILNLNASKWIIGAHDKKLIVCNFFIPILPLQYNIKKKEEPVEMVQEEPNPLMRKKKTPEELAAEAEQEDLDDFTSKLFSFKNNPFSSLFR